MGDTNKNTTGEAFLLIGLIGFIIITTLIVFSIVGFNKGGDGVEWLLFVGPIILGPLEIIQIVFIAIGLGILLHSDSNEQSVKKDSIETISVSNEKTDFEDDNNGTLVKCHYCGKEQEKNALGCIYCHRKL